MVAIIDYGLGNLGSIKNMLNKIGADSIITNKPEHIRSAEKLLLPGVGAFDKGIENLEKLDLINILNYEVLEKNKIILGICLGMQLMTEKSEEGKLNGLGWIPAETLKFNFNEDINLRIPHMGWNVIKPATDSKILPNTFDELKYYFVHSFYVAAKQSSIIKGTTTYGCDFTSVFEYENIFGVQFHPEKSHKYGQELFKRFLEL